MCPCQRDRRKGRATHRKRLRETETDVQRKGERNKERHTEKERLREGQKMTGTGAGGGPPREHTGHRDRHPYRLRGFQNYTGTWRHSLRAAGEQRGRLLSLAGFAGSPRRAAWLPPVPNAEPLQASGPQPPSSKPSPGHWSWWVTQGEREVTNRGEGM